MKNVLWNLKLEIETQYGKRCKDYNPLCAVCIMWSAFDTLYEGLEPNSVRILGKKKTIRKKLGKKEVRK